jgi:hypothetical protein
MSSWEARSDGAFSPADDDIPFPAALVQHILQCHGFYNAGDLERANTKLQVMHHEHYQRHWKAPSDPDQPDHDHVGDELWAFGKPRP